MRKSQKSELFKLGVHPSVPLRNVSMLKKSHIRLSEVCASIAHVDFLTIFEFLDLCCSAEGRLSIMLRQKIR